ncbi:MAG: hypothetical protein AAFU71_08060 [Cyanobacteria bacterium J06632_22]
MSNLPAFRPSLHGFRFVNRFAVHDIANALPLDQLEIAVPPLSGSYGLCGGMSAAVADYYQAGQAIPTTNQIPQPGEPLYRYLVRRQRHTLGKTGKPIARFLAWMGLSDIALQVLTGRELNAVLAQLDQGDFAILGLVHVGPSGKPWDNHQVLAYGYEYVAGNRVRIKVYEPNAPLADDAYLEVTRTRVKLNPETLAGLRSLSALPNSLQSRLLKLPAALPNFLLPTVVGVTCRKHRGNNVPVRGFFRMPYVSAVPKLEGSQLDRPVV